VARLRATYDTLVERGGDAAFAGEVRALREAFAARTGAFGPEDRWFEVRSAAFWDDVVCSPFARRLAEGLGEDVLRATEALRRAHRGLFRVRAERGAFTLSCVVSGIELSIDPPSGGLLDALTRADGLVDGRVAGSPEEVVLLPGAFFHPPDATEAITALLPVADARALEKDELLDALLRMELSLHALSRVRPSFAYREAALPRGKR
jgi:hypothetical protein